MEAAKRIAQFDGSPCCFDKKINIMPSMMTGLYLLDNIRINLGFGAESTLVDHSLSKRTAPEERTDDQETLCFGRISRERLLQIDCHCDRWPACRGRDAADSSRMGFGNYFYVRSQLQFPGWPSGLPAQQLLVRDAGNHRSQRRRRVHRSGLERLHRQWVSNPRQDAD